jgi:hypothetical protein
MVQYHEIASYYDIACWSKGESVSSHSDLDGMGSIPASPDALNVPLLLYQERFNEASLPDIA